MRPEILFPLFAPSTSLKGVGPKLAPLVEKLAGPKVRDVLFTIPQRIIRRRRTTCLDARDGEVQTFTVHVDEHIRPRRDGLPYRIRCTDGTGFIFLIFFKVFGDHLLKTHPIGAARAVSGRAERYNGVELQMTHPDYLIDAKLIDQIPDVETVYPAAAGLASRQVRKFALEALDYAPALPEWIDGPWKAKNQWPGWREAFETVHHPVGEGDLDPQTPARRRLAYDELLAHQLALARRKAAFRRTEAPAITASPLSEKLEAALPFRLTGAQIQALSEIRGDLASGQRMSRLLQGDVGSGKTVVAMLAAADVAAAGLQTVIMAPTEILARQHFETIAAPLEAIGAKTILLTGRDKGKPRSEKLRQLAFGEVAVAVGTHALFQDDVAFNNLAFAVIDEQHRFGVAERQRLQAKGEHAHLLAMSATPIPRTLELTVYGDLDVSRLEEKPPGRTPVATRAVPSARIGEVVARLKQVAASGAQAFWICPLVSESEMSDLAAAEGRAADLRRHLGPSVGMVHGRIAGVDKDQVMSDFADGKVSVLVATTVVEVGVNVPNASIMVIEHADRFGLAQLHQLRGRVGRGARESACVLLYDPPLSKAGEARLNILRETDDGFLIAERDLELRGGGDPLGLKQSGFPAYRLADPVAHRDLIAPAADEARLMLALDPDLAAERSKAVRVLIELFDWKPAGLAEAG